MPKKICNTPGCNNLIPMSERYCISHKIEKVASQNKNYNRFRRNKKHQVFYDSKEWKQARITAMQRTGGLCEECLKFDLVIKADVVDHIIPISKDFEKRLKQSNLMPLCHSHHNKKTAKENLQKGGRV